jgi:ATP-dependent DNA helicase RecG
LNSDILEKMIAGGETSRVEFKIAPPRPVEIAQRLCGFANGAGGYLILGVVDKTLEIVGLRHPAEAIDTVLQGARLCKPALNLENPEPEFVTIKGKSLVVVSVPPNSGPLYQASGVFWIRRGSHTIPLEANEIEQHLYNRGIASWERRVVSEAGLEDLDFEQVRALIESRPERTRVSRRLANLEEVLISLNCAQKMENGIIRPTNAGLLLFGKTPQQFILQSEVTCVLYGENLGSRRYRDRKILGGTIRELIDGAEDFFTRYVAVGARMEGFHRVDEPEYLVDVLREAVVNAVVHRDYSLEGESIRIFYYPDRVEIRNPGLLLPGLTIEELGRGQARSKLRNPVLAGVLRDLPGGYMERMGSGVKFMLDEQARLGYPAPEFKELGEFIVTFKSPFSPQVVGEDRPKEAGIYSLKEENVRAGSGPETPKVKTDEPNTLVEARLEKLMHYLHQHGSITNREYRLLTGVSESTGLRDFETLLARKAIRVVGKRRARHYTLP